MKCNVTGTRYTVFGYKGKQVRDNLHSADLVRAFDRFFQSPRSGEVYNIGGSRFSNCSMLEAIAMCQQISGREMNWQYGDGNRKGDHNLVVCADCDHADAIATFLTRVLGRRPAVAYSRLLDPSDPEPANAIRDFKRGHDPWIVAVNMVSEGVDVRRLRAVVHLTNRLTLLSFRQIVGRVVRTDARNVDDHGRVYLPADPSLVSMATAITDEVSLLPPPMTIVIDPKHVCLLSFAVAMTTSVFRSKPSRPSASVVVRPTQVIGLPIRHCSRWLRRTFERRSSPHRIQSAWLSQRARTLALREAIEKEVHERH